MDHPRTRNAVSAGGGLFSKRTSYHLSSQRIGFILIIFGFLWGMYLVYMTGQQRGNESDVLKSQIIALSKKYIESLAQEKSFSEADVVRGQTSGDKHTTALLLKNMLDRIQHLEKDLRFVIINSTLEFAKMSRSIATLNSTMNILTRFNRSGGVFPMSMIRCALPNDTAYPDCKRSVEHLKLTWKDDPKYLAAGVNGSLCSILLYLSQIDNVCPTNFPAELVILPTQATSVPGEGIASDCVPKNHPNFPVCEEKVKWLISNWRTGRVYIRHGVDGSPCSFIRYLSEVEHHCPPLAGNADDFLVSEQEQSSCRVPNDAAFPECKSKVSWMRTSWKTHPCYVALGVNGTLCSYLVYLSEVENWCPLLPGRSLRTRPPVLKHVNDVKEKPKLDNLSLAELLSVLRDNSEIKLQWVKGRITRLWPEWVDGLSSLRELHNITSYPRKKVLIYIGLLADELVFHFGQGATTGGPLGELVQWSDIITSLYLLGHDIKVIVNKENGIRALIKSLGSPCPNYQSTEKEYDIIYTDYIGLLHLNKGKNIGSVKCHLRVVDSFGTEAQFNHLTNSKLRSTFTGQDLDLRQYNTMFPHSPDNTFLGFVVENHLKEDHHALHKKPIALIYGKHVNMWKDSKRLKFLDIVQQYFKVHATVGGKNADEIRLVLPRYVVNHGVLSGPALQRLLQDAKVFIGLGFPYEGPAPLEAIANGCFFINAKLNPPLGRGNAKFFKAKPTFRKLTSQHPYAETFIGSPYVYTLELNDTDSVIAAMEEIQRTQVKPYLPREFSYVGMLERLYALTKHQDFCHPKDADIWPPVSSLQVVLADPMESCKDACLRQGLICEPTHFPTVNLPEAFTRANVTCSHVSGSRTLYNPVIELTTNECELQQSPFYYSCSAAGVATARRVCPCRDYVRGQTALCRDCLSDE